MKPSHYSIFNGVTYKTLYYYVRVEPRMGFWKARFALVPMTAEALSSEDLQEDIKSCQAVQLNADGIAWFDANYDSMTVKLVNGLEDYAEREAKGKPVRFVKPEYGVDMILY